MFPGTFMVQGPGLSDILHQYVTCHIVTSPQRWVAVFTYTLIQNRFRPYVALF